MSLDPTQQTINGYFDVIGRGDDFVECYAADVTSTATDMQGHLRFVTTPWNMNALFLRYQVAPGRRLQM
jgi:hypothetical protein